MSDNQERERRVVQTDQNGEKCLEVLYFNKSRLKIERGGAKVLLLFSFFLAALRSTCSSSRLCWFTTATCTQDISWHTGVALPRPTLPSALSGFGCRTTRCEKPACRRSCLPTLTCFSTRGCKDWTSLCTQKNNQQLCSGFWHLWHWSYRISARNILLCRWQWNGGGSKSQRIWTWSILLMFGTYHLLLFNKQKNLTQKRGTSEDIRHWRSQLCKISIIGRRVWFIIPWTTKLLFSF